ncbi:MAG TPA: hypothetical protein PLB01_18085 [Thermoanaerobaculia bacterium]|nr:hypothetical protein [Thermoanaerobaculia bacterium]
MRAALLVLAIPLAFFGPAFADDEAPLAEADRLWSLRADGSTGGRARAEAIDPVIAACRTALEKEPDSVAARGRLMRALYFKGEHVADDVTTKRDIFDEGRKVAEQALGLLRRDASKVSGRDLSKGTPVDLAPHLRGRADAVDAFYWAAADWGKWSLAFGKMAAVKQGAAAKIRDYAQAVILLDPSFNGGGGYRILGRLHHQTPSVPFLTGWASRAEALKNLRLAVATGPKDFLGRQFLAEAIWDYEPDKRAEARALMQVLVNDTPQPEWLVECRRSQEDAAAKLREWGK